MHSGQGLGVTLFVRMLLCSLVRVKLGCYELEGKNSQSLEEYLKAFMETEVKPLWPKGWMQTRCLSSPQTVCSSHSKNAIFVFIYTCIYIFSVQQDFIQREHYDSWSPHRLLVSLSTRVVFLASPEVRFFDVFLIELGHAIGHVLFTEQRKKWSKHPKPSQR